MITLTFEGSSMENVNRQIVRYAEMITGCQLTDRPGRHQAGNGRTQVDQPRFIPSEADGNMTVGYKRK